MVIKRFARLRVALSLEASALRMLVINGRRIQSWMDHPLPPDMVRDGAVVAPRPFEAVLSTLFAGREGLKRHLSACLPGNRALLRTVSLPRLKPALLQDAIQREARRELPVEPQQLHLFWQPFFATRDREDFLLVWMRKDAFDPVYAAFRRVKAQPRLWELKPLALVRAVGQAEAVILDLEQENANLIMVAEGVPRLVRSLVSSAELPRDEWMRRLSGEVSQAIDHYLANSSSESGRGKPTVVLTGPLSTDSRLVQVLKDTLSLPVEPFQCPLQSPAGFPAATYAAALGVALKKGRSPVDQMGRRAIDFNVLPYPDRRVRLAAKPIAVGAALALAAALLVPMFQARANSAMELSDQQAELARLQRRVSLVKSGLVQRSELQAKIDQTKEHMRLLQQERSAISATRGEVAEDLKTALEMVPPGVSTTRIASQRDVIVVEGETPTSAALLEYARALERSGRFSTVAITGLTQKSQGNDPSSATFALSLGRSKAAER